MSGRGIGIQSKVCPSEAKIPGERSLPDQRIDILDYSFLSLRFIYAGAEIRGTAFNRVPIFQKPICGEYTRLCKNRDCTEDLESSLVFLASTIFQ